MIASAMHTNAMINNFYMAKPKEEEDTGKEDGNE